MRRAWAAPLWAHSLVLAALLVAVGLVAGTDVSFSSDEGAAIAQVELLASGQGWTEANAFPTIDPEGRAYFFDPALSSGGPDAFAPYAKHPLYVLLLRPAEAVGGQWGMVGLSILGAVLAALAAAMVARELDPRLDRWALWTVGAATPLVFDSQLVEAHTLGTALAGVAVLASTRLLRRTAVLPALVAVGAVVPLALLRTEGVLFALALGAVLGILGLRRRSWPVVVTAGAVGVAALVTNVLEKRWTRSLLGRSGGGGISAIEATLGDRLVAMTTSTIQVGEAWPTIARVGLVLSLLAAVVTPLVLRRGVDPARVVTVGGVVGCAGLALAVVGGRPDTVPSLLVACPVLTVGILLVRRDVWTPPAVLLGATSGLYAAAVFATQYGQAGGAEWGARFLALLLPAAVPLALRAIQVQGEVTPAARKPGLGFLVAASVAMTALSVWTLATYHQNIRDWNTVMAEALTGREGPDLGDGDTAPVVVTTWSGLGRFLWPLDEPRRGLMVPADLLEEYAARLDEAGVEELVFVALDGADGAAGLDGHYELTETVPPGLGEAHTVWIARSRDG